MSTHNKTLVLDFFAAICGQPSSRSLADFFAADVVWYVPQSNPLVTANPRRGHAAVMALMASGVGIYKPDSLHIEQQRLIADDSQVAAQFTLSAQLANGNPYINHYCFVFSIAGDQIDGVWEYLDTLYQSRQGTFDGLN